MPRQKFFHRIVDGLHLDAAFWTTFVVQCRTEWSTPGIAIVLRHGTNLPRAILRDSPSLARVRALRFQSQHGRTSRCHARLRAYVAPPGCAYKLAGSAPAPALSAP